MSDSSVSTGLSLYGYVPSKGAGIIFVIAFVVTTLLHVFQATRSRAWWLLPTVVVAGIAEVIGWVARTQSAYDPTPRTPFIIQTSILVLAPTPLVAALFMGFGKVVERLGVQYSRLRPVLYSRVFLTADIISLFIQGGGGGLAASGASNPDNARLGSNIILGGLFVQIVSMTFFCFLMGEYAWRRSRNQPFHKFDCNAGQPRWTFDRKMKMLLVAILVPTGLIYIRSIYRIIEFIDGFGGSIAHNQVLFIIFDATLVAFSLYTLNFMHPGTLLQAIAHSESYAMAGTTTPPGHY